MKILVIDDEPLLRSLLTTVLQAEGHETIEATSVARALGELRIHSFDVVVTDNDLPERDGGLAVVEAASMLTQRPLIIWASGRAYDQELVGWAKECGADVVLAKPFSVTDDFLPAIARRMQTV